MSLTADRQTPANYITYGLRAPDSLFPHQFGTMLAHHFETMERDDAEDVFRKFHQAAQERPALAGAFHTAIKQSFLALKPGAPSADRRWDGVMTAIVEAARTDEVLATYVRRDLIGASVPALIGSPKTTDSEYRAASDILAAAGADEQFADAVDPALAHRIVKWHLARHRNDFTRAAEDLTRLRNVTAFTEPVAEIEDRHGVHVRAARVSDLRDPGSLVLRFDRARHHVEAYVLREHRGHAATQELALDDDAVPHRDQVAGLLKEESEADTTPAWAAPIAAETHAALTAGPR